MYARSTTMQMQPSSIDAGIAFIRDEVMPALQGMAGCIGMSLLVDRQSGRCVTTSAWETEDALRASAAEIAPMRDRAAQMFPGTPTDEHWEIAVLHRNRRAPEGAGVRATWVQVPQGQMDQAIEFYKASVLPQMADVDGFCSASLLVDRPSGHAVSSMTFEDRDAMRHTRALAAVAREPGSTETIGEILDVAEYDLALAHLHVPEQV